MFSYGTDHGDKKLAADTDSTFQLKLKVPVIFFGREHNDIFVSVRRLFAGCACAHMHGDKVVFTIFIRKQAENIRGDMFTYHLMRT